MKMQGKPDTVRQCTPSQQRRKQYRAPRLRDLDADRETAAGGTANFDGLSSDTSGFVVT